MSNKTAVRARFDCIRGSYRRYKTAMNKSLSLGKSGSGAKVLKPPKTYKYAAEAAFLDAAFKFETIVDTMDSSENTSYEDEDTSTDSFTSAVESAIAKRDRSGRIRKKTTESDFNAVLVAAVQSIGKLASSVIDSRKNEKAKELDEDWLFAKIIYIKLKDVPAGREKELCKMRMQTELMNLMYDD